MTKERSSYPEKGATIIGRVNIIHPLISDDPSFVKEGVFYRCNCSNQNCKKFIVVWEDDLLPKEINIIEWRYGGDRKRIRRTNKECGIHR